MKILIVVSGGSVPIGAKLAGGVRDDGHDPVAVRQRNQPDVALADSAVHTREHALPAADPLALDPLSPIASRPDHRWFRPAH
jgi:hypothetical protein